MKRSSCGSCCRGARGSAIFLVASEKLPGKGLGRHVLHKKHLHERYISLQAHVGEATCRMSLNREATHRVEGVLPCNGESNGKEHGNCCYTTVYRNHFVIPFDEAPGTIILVFL